jgi:hypothetical protein
MREQSSIILPGLYSFQHTTHINSPVPLGIHKPMKGDHRDDLSCLNSIGSKPIPVERITPAYNCAIVYHTRILTQQHWDGHVLSCSRFVLFDTASRNDGRGKGFVAADQRLYAPRGLWTRSASNGLCGQSRNRVQNLSAQIRLHLYTGV